MDRRAFIERFLSVFALGSILLLGGCEKGEKPSGLGTRKDYGNWQTGRRN